MNNNIKDSIKAQAATEYMIIVGFVFLTLLITLSVLSSYGTDTFDEIIGEQIQQICLNIIDMSERVADMGEPGRLTKAFSFPKGIRNISIAINDPSTGCTECTELRFHVIKGGNPDIIACSTPIVLTQDSVERAITPGTKNVKVEAVGTGVFINWTS